MRIVIAKWQQLGLSSVYRLTFHWKQEEGEKTAKAQLQLERLSQDAMGGERWEPIDSSNVNYIRLLTTGLHVSRCSDLWPNSEVAANLPEATAAQDARGGWRIHVNIAGETFISWQRFEDDGEVAKKVIQINEELRRG